MSWSKQAISGFSIVIAILAFCQARNPAETEIISKAYLMSRQTELRFVPSKLMSSVVVGGIRVDTWRDDQDLGKVISVVLSKDELIPLVATPAAGKEAEATLAKTYSKDAALIDREVKRIRTKHLK